VVIKEKRDTPVKRKWKKILGKDAKGREFRLQRLHRGGTPGFISQKNFNANKMAQGRKLI